MYRNYPFFKDLLDVFMRGLSAKKPNWEQQTVFPPSLSIAHGPRSCSWYRFLPLEVPLTWGALRDLLRDLKTKARDNINAGFFCPPFFIILFTFNFTQASQSTFIIFSNTTMGFFKFTRDLNCSPQKPFLSVFWVDALSILKSVYSNRFFLASSQEVRNKLKVFGFLQVIKFRLVN